MVSAALIRMSRQLIPRVSIRPRASVALRFESTSTVHENDPETLEKEKQRNLSGIQHKTSTPHENAPGWNEYLASASEAAVKADRSEGDPDVLQKKTAEHIRARHHADEDDATERNTRTGPEFQKEGVQGPLGSAKGDVAGPSERSGGVAGGKP